MNCAAEPPGDCRVITSQTWAFVIVAFILTITPGSDTMLVLRSALARGRAAGLVTTLGITSGLFIHAALSALGLSLILLRSAEAFIIVKWAGAVYLGYLGVSSLLAAVRHGQPDIKEDALSLDARPRQGWRSFTEGLLNNVLNPKVAIFYLAFLPQFVVPDSGSVLGQSLTLAAIHGLMGIVWLSGVAFLTDTLRKVVTHPQVRRGIEGFAGLVLLGFGVRLALEQR
jgi:threonine/homoserine/homoserine lactone efflux protein